MRLAWRKKKKCSGRARWTTRNQDWISRVGESRGLPRSGTTRASTIRTSTLGRGALASSSVPVVGSSCSAHAGDFLLVPKAVIHRKLNPATEEKVALVF